MKFAFPTLIIFTLIAISVCAFPNSLTELTSSDSSHILLDNKKTPEEDSIRKALWLAIKNAKDSSGSASVRFDYGKYLDGLGESDASLAQIEMAFATAKNAANDSLIASIANYLAFVYWVKGDFSASIQSYETGLQSAERSHDSSTIAKISMNLANNYNYLGAYDKAIQNALYALKIKEAANDMERICYHYVSMSNIFRENNNTAKWEEYLNKAWRMKDVEGCASLGDVAKIYNGLGGIAREREQFGSALAYYDTLMSLSREAGYDQGINTALSNSAIIYEQLGELQKALDMSIEAEQYFGNNQYDRIFANNFKAGLYQALQQAETALALVDENIKNEEIESYSTEKLKSLNLLYEVNFALGNYQAAYRWNEAYRVLDNIIRDETVRKTIEDVETQYETEKKEQQISLLQAENKIGGQRVRLSLLFIGFLVLLVALTLALLFFRRRQARFRQSEIQQQLLRSQMNPHFIFNVMGSIQSYLYKNEAGRAADYLSRFASLSRSVLDFSSQERVSLKEEIEMLQNYIELERAGQDKPFEVVYNIDPEIESEFIEIPPMLLQPFVENAIKHGLSNLPYPGKLSLTFVEEPENICVEVLDNGAGISTINNGMHKSKALEIFRQRKKNIEHRHKKALTFEIQDLKAIDSTRYGVRVYLQIPILNND